MHWLTSLLILKTKSPRLRPASYAREPGFALDTRGGHPTCDLREMREGERKGFASCACFCVSVCLCVCVSVCLCVYVLSRPLSTSLSTSLSLCICASTDLSLRLKPNEMLTSLRWMAMGSFGVSFTSSRNSYTSVGSCGWGRALHRQHNEKNTRMHSTNRAVRSTQTRHKQTKSRPPPPPSLHKADGCTPAALARWLRCHADKRRCGSR